METDRGSANADMSPGDRVGAYRVEGVSDIFNGNRCYRLTHLPTGADHVHIASRDRENTFAVAFKTVPVDSTGVAHILEHTVLCGSRNFPVRDPFFSMLKRSLNTFMNAFTSSDWTMYPFCTQNRKDFYNLLGVYLDSVFYPNLDELSFQQEGHRLAFSEDGADGKAPLVYKGVVYNEMKGAMSSPDDILIRSLMKALYPSTTYRFNSGGDPAVIPHLTHRQLVDFHRRHYHPSNGYFFTYGDLPLTEHLDFIHERYLKHFQRIDPETEVPPQPRWSSPREVEIAYPASGAEDLTRKAQICVGWLTADIRDTYEVLVLKVLEHVLLGHSGSPLRKALIESGLGSSLSDGTGYDADNRDTLFACGLKDVRLDSKDEIVSIIFDTLSQLHDQGIDRELVDSALHQIEFHRREVSNTPYPYGLKIMMTISSSWFHGGSLARVLNFDEDIRRLRAAVDAGGFLEERLMRYLIDNPHRVVFCMVPDADMQEKEDKRVAEELREIQSRLSAADEERIREATRRLQALQEASEDVSVLPTLALSDIPENVPVVDPSGTPALPPATVYEQPTAGIFYFSAAFGVGRVPARLLPLVPFFCHVLPKVGTRRRDYAALARMISAVTGGLHLTTQAHSRFDQSADCLSMVGLGGKCLNRNQDRMADIFCELIADHEFSDLPRIKTLLLEYRAAMESMVVHNGHRLAISLSARNFSRTRAITEMWNGVEQLRFIKDFTENPGESRLADLAGHLKEIGRLLFGHHNVQMAVIGDADALKQTEPGLRRICDALDRESSDGFCEPALDVAATPVREGWSTATAVSFVAETFPTVRLGHEDAPVLYVLSKMLRSLYLHREIREKGGAYGGFALYNPEDGLFSFASYRDPHIQRTLDIYAAVPVFLENAPFSDEDIKEAILQVCSDIDKPDAPAAAARQAFARRLIGLTDDTRRTFKKRLLQIRRDELVRVVETYFQEPFQRRCTAVISGEEPLARANEALKSRPLSVARI